MTLFPKHMWIIFAVLVVVPLGFGQINPNLTNYDEVGVKGIVRLTGTGEITSDIVTHKTTAHLSCESGDMVVTVKFMDPFRGIVYAGDGRATPCKAFGDGGKSITVRMPLRGCGTYQRPVGVFTNTIIVRFHPSLEVEEDEVKTIVCRYPPPIAPPPSNLTILPPPPFVQPQRPELSEPEILLIISAILFLTLLLLGICCAYYCLKRRNIKIVRKKKAVSTIGSDITKLSGMTGGPIEQFRIPRANPPAYEDLEQAMLTSGSGDIIPSDYPSDSPSTLTSDIDEYEMRRTEMGNVRQEHNQFVNAGFSADEDRLSVFPSDKEPDVGSFIIPASVVARPDPKLHERFLTTVIERENVRTEEDIDRIHAVTTQYHLKDEMKPALLPPVIITREEEQAYDLAEQEVDLASSMYPDYDRDNMIVDNDLMTETMNVSEFKEDKSFIRYMSLPRGGPETAEAETQVVLRQPKVEVKNIEDRFLTTTTDIEESEIITKHSRDTVEYSTNPKNPEDDEDWDVIIRTYPPDTNDIGVGPQNSLPPSRTPSLYSERPGSVRSDYSEASRRTTTSGWDVLIRVLNPADDRRMFTEDDMEVLDLPIPEKDRNTLRTLITTDSTFRTLVQEATTYEEYVTISRDVRYEHLLESESWEVIIRVLNRPYDTYDGPNAGRRRRPRLPGKAKYRNVDGYEAEDDDYYGSTRGRESLPPVYEADGRHSSTSTWAKPPNMGSVASRKTMSNREYDMRSMTEEEVNFTRGADKESIWSAGSVAGGRQSIAERSTSEYVEDVPQRMYSNHPRSYERSTSEFVTTATDTIPVRQSNDYVEKTSGERRHPSRFLERSSTEYMEDIPTITLDDMALGGRHRRSAAASLVSYNSADSINTLNDFNSSFGATAMQTTNMAASSSSAVHRTPMTATSTRFNNQSTSSSRAMDLASADRRENRSVTETYTYDWGR